METNCSVRALVSMPEPVPSALMMLDPVELFDAGGVEVVVIELDTGVVMAFLT